ncbi:hypothetical protein [Falsiroseomonas sp. CW058]|uniref:hypothetical protein n=1 Tax=Falsiroseomonas sp. CW058 TaxID=3388664 RepID=UPI003D318F5D
MTVVLLINGPPRAGKDTLASHLIERIGGATRRRMAHELKVRTHRLYDCPPESWDDPDYYDDVKDVPSAQFHGLSPRAAYIAVSETYFKPTHGEEFFGELFVRWLDGIGPETRLVAVPDSGFLTEVRPILRRVGLSRLLLVRVHAGGRGKSFAGDSRGYIDIPRVPTLDVRNDVDGRADLFLEEAEVWVRSQTGLFHA